jgi:hypothetical protein
MHFAYAKQKNVAAAKSPQMELATRGRGPGIDADHFLVHRGAKR